MTQARELELCVQTLQACEAAAEGRADRIELCSALSVGGVTPSRGLVHAALALSAVPVHVLLRPRGGDFVYTAAEFDVLCADLDDAFACGAVGVVLGLLTPSGEIDRVRTGLLIDRADGRPVTFHRAFDHSRRLSESLELLIDLGCSRVLTSGGRPTVIEGVAMLESLANQAQGRIRVAAGGGVRLRNAARLCEIEGLDLHASLLSEGLFESSRAVAAGGLPADPLWSEDAFRGILSASTVRALGDIVRSHDTTRELRLGRQREGDVSAPDRLL